MRRSLVITVLAAALAQGCGEEEDVGGQADAGPGPTVSDSGPSGNDGGPAGDAGPSADAGPSDGGPVSDAGPDDAGPAGDAGPSADAGPSDGGPAASGETCAEAIALAPDTTVNGADTAGASDDYDPGEGSGRACSSLVVSYDGPDVAYTIDVPAGKRLTVTVVPEASFDIAVAIVGDCESAGGSCLAGSDRSPDGGTERAIWINDGASRSVFVLVDSWDRSATGSYTIRATIDDPPAPPLGDQCSAPATLVDGVPQSGDTTGARDNDDPGLNHSDECAALAYVYDGPDVVYQISVPAKKELEVTASAEWDIALAIVTDCADQGPSCVAGADANEGGTEVATYANTTAQAQTVFVVVDAWDRDEYGPFTIRATLRDAPETPANDTCEAATALSDGATVQGDSRVAANDYAVGGAPANACSMRIWGGAGRDVAYSASVGPGQELTVTVVPLSAWDPAVAIVRSCGDADSSCLAARDFYRDGGTEVVTYFNETDATDHVFVIVDSATGGEGGQFMLSAAFSTPGARVAGDLCGTAPTLTSGVPVTGTTAGARDDYDTMRNSSEACEVEYIFPGRDLAYQIAVPASSKLTAVLESTDFDPSLHVIRDCAAEGPSCLGLSDRDGSGATEVVEYINRGEATNLVLLVDGYSPTRVGTFKLTATVEAVTLPEGDQCVDAPTLTPGQVVQGDTTLAANDYTITTPSTLCRGNLDPTVTYEGNDVTYQVLVPAGQTLTVTLSPDVTWDPVLLLVLNCAAPGASCQAASDVEQSGVGEQEQAIWRNTGSTDQLVYVIVDSWHPDSYGTFELVAELSQ